MLLADLGADVLRLERGDADADHETTWELLNRSRPSVALDLKNPAGRDLVLELCEQADVLIEGFRPGVTERLGLGPEDVAKRNPRLVYARMTGYGQDGPNAQRAGHDINYIAVSGALWPMGRKGEAPVPPLNLVGDFGGGSLFLVFGVVAAVLSARSTGEGQVVDVAMVDGSASLMTLSHSLMNAGFWHEERGSNLLDTGAPFYEVYETKDARYLAVGPLEPHFFAILSAKLGLDASYGSQLDVAQWPAQKEKLAAIFRTRTRDEWTSLFDGTDACVSPVLSLGEAPGHPHNAARRSFVDVGGLTQPAPTPRFSRTEPAAPDPAKPVGADTRAVLARYGFTPAEVDALLAEGAIAEA
jgi:alpha-methylacyl-CoA racemase